MTATDLEFEFDSEFLNPDDIDPTAEQVDEEIPDSEPGEFIEESKETARAKKYRLKAKHGLNFLMRAFAGNPRTVSDAAAIVQHGPGISQAVGHLCDTDARARKIVDFITDDGIDNPYVLLGLATIPLVLQTVRNHEQGLEKGAQLKIPLGRKRRLTLPFKFSIKLRKMRAATYDPDFLTAHVFGNPIVQEAFRKQGIRVAWPGAQ